MSEHKGPSSARKETVGAAYWQQRHARELAAYLSGHASRGELKSVFETLKQQILSTQLGLEILIEFVVSKGIGTVEQFREFATAIHARIESDAAALQQVAEAGQPTEPAAEKSGSDLPLVLEPAILLPDQEGAADASPNAGQRGSADAEAGEGSQPALDVQAADEAEAPAAR